jgi:Protein tyrosine and serine/threonine kinase
MAADKGWGLYFDESPSGDGPSLNLGRRSGSSEAIGGEGNGWPSSAFAALLLVILLSAFFLHLISDAQKSNHRGGGSGGKGYKNSSLLPVPKVTRKKKTDEWNEDEYAMLGGPAGISVSHSLSTDETNVAAGAIANHFPSIQPGGLQHHRHRKLSATSSTLTPSFQPKSYYLNPASGAVIAPYKSPAPTSASRTPTNLSRPVLADDAIQGFRIDQPPPMPVQLPASFQQRTSLNPQILSNASSFGSSMTDATPDLPSRQNEAPTQSPPLSPSVEFALTPSRQSKLWLSPGTDDVTPTSKTPIRIRLSDVVEETPRAANLRIVRKSNHGLISDDLRPPSFHNTKRKEHDAPPIRPSFSIISGSSETYRFAAPPSPSRQVAAEVPFLPRLDVHVAAEPQPRSMNLDDLHLYQMMESGNVSHWEARVAEESKRLQDQVFPSTPKRENAAILNNDSENSSTDHNSEIPSNDVRKSIHHKRSDLTNATDAASSLQGAIEFSELRLVEVIGGGGFGQVWKAVWRGTPVAVKVLTGSAQSKNVPKPVLEEFVAEINLLKGMRHPNICLYMGACLDPPNRAIITELAANGSLWDALRLPLMPPYVACDGMTRDSWPVKVYLPDSRHGTPPSVHSASALMHSSSSSLGQPSNASRISHPVPPRGTWPWELVKRVACGAARGMAYLHSGKPPVLHRDLKVRMRSRAIDSRAIDFLGFSDSHATFSNQSANILLDESYTAKVCDFGLSRLKSQGNSMTANVGTVQVRIACSVASLFFCSASH